MMFNFQKLLLILLIKVLLLHSLSCVNLQIDRFEKEKLKIESKINSMRLGNYLRKLLLKVKIS